MRGAVVPLFLYLMYIHVSRGRFVREGNKTTGVYY